MAKQDRYKNAPTAKSVLFAMWDDNHDDTNPNLALCLSISIHTVRSYRVEWRKRHNRGVKKNPEVVMVSQGQLPLETKKGVVWHVWKLSDEERLWCDDCPVRKECKEKVCCSPVYHYLGCEQVYRSELWPDSEQNSQTLR